MERVFIFGNQKFNFYRSGGSKRRKKSFRGKNYENYRLESAEVPSNYPAYPHRFSDMVSSCMRVFPWFLFLLARFCDLDLHSLYHSLRFLFSFSLLSPKQFSSSLSYRHWDELLISVLPHLKLTFMATFTLLIILILTRQKATAHTTSSKKCRTNDIKFIQRKKSHFEFLLVNPKNARRTRKKSYFDGVPNRKENSSFIL